MDILLFFFCFTFDFINSHVGLAPPTIYPLHNLSDFYNGPCSPYWANKEYVVDLDQNLIEEIIGRILAVTQAERIILFGSAASGEMTRDSDIDLLVLKSAPGDPRQESVAVRQALMGLDHPFDIIVMATERFEESKGVIGGIAFPANKYGKVIYEAA